MVMQSNVSSSAIFELHVLVIAISIEILVNKITDAYNIFAKLFIICLLILNHPIDLRYMTSIFIYPASVADIAIPVTPSAFIKIALQIAFATMLIIAAMNGVLVSF